MVVCVHYCAIPPQSRLYACLQEDRAFNTLMVHLFPYGCGVYLFSATEPEGVGILDDMIDRHRLALGPEPEARRRAAEFLAELERTRAEFPGIERRTAMLEKCATEIKGRLAQILGGGQTDAAALVRRIMFGDEEFAPHLGQPEGDVLGLVSLPVVREAAVALAQLGPEALFPAGGDWGQWCRDNYSEWRQTYLEAAEHGEEILVGVS